MPPPRRAVLGLAVVGLGASVAPLDFSVNVAFPAITQAFALDTRAIRWVAVCYVLVYGSLMLAFGALGDRIGHLRLFRAGLALGVLAFTACAMATTYPVLLAARALQGVAVALTLSCAPALATALFPESRRTWALSVHASIAALAGVLAPLLGGVMVDALGWTGVYWFRVPLLVAALACLPVLREGLASAPAGRGSAGGSPSAFDAAGAVLLAGALALWLLLPALPGTGVAPWVLPGLFVLGAGLLIAFVRRQRGAAVPFLPRALVRDPGFILQNVGNVVVQFGSFAVPLVVPYYLMRVEGWGALAIGLLLSVWAAGTLAGSAAAPRVVRRFGDRGAAVLGGLLAAAGLAGVASWPPSASVPWMVAALAFQGLGLGLYQVAYTDLVIAALPITQRGVAGSLTMVTRTVGVILGASILTAVQQSGAAEGLAESAAFLTGFGRVFLLGAAVIAALAVISRCSGSAPRGRP